MTISNCPRCEVDLPKNIPDFCPECKYDLRNKEVIQHSITQTNPQIIKKPKLSLTNSSFNDFMSFKKLVSYDAIVSLYKVLFVILNILFALGLIFIPFLPYMSFGKKLLAIPLYLLWVLFMNSLWRIICESWIIFFGIHERLVEIENNTSTAK